MNEDLFIVLMQICIPLILLILGLVVGRTVEKRHFRSLAKREQELAHIMVTDLRTIPENWRIEQAFLVSGSVVIANDYFKAFASALRNLFGGQMRSYELLVERGRRSRVASEVRRTRRGGVAGDPVYRPEGPRDQRR